MSAIKIIVQNHVGYPLPGTEDLLLLVPPPPQSFSNICDNTATASAKIFSSGRSIKCKSEGASEGKQSSEGVWGGVDTRMSLDI